MTFREAADRESGLCYNIGVQVNLLFDCPKKGASMKQSSNKKSREATAFLYERLSRDDNLEGESYSIGNQKKLLTKVAKEKGYTNLVHFLDDGISGVTMNRPGFVEMMQQLEQGKAAAVFVKDLSRLGRNYIEVGRLTEEFFPDHDIRLVAVSDNIDTAEGENELAPIRNLFNEWYARDISKKRRISNKIKGNSGEPMGLPPYGYIKNPNNPKYWVIDEEAAQVVRRIIENRPRPKNEPMVDGKCGFLFLDQNGNPTVAMHWEHYFNHICTSYNKLYREQLPNITPHVCRHTFCSNMAKSGMNPKTLQYLMGHSDIGVTLNTYTHVQYDDVETEMKRVVNAE